MSIKAVLFDLDGTLLPMDQDKFIKRYFKELTTYLFVNGGYEPTKFMESMNKSIGAMMKNDGTKTNEEAFWQVFSSIYGAEKVKSDMLIFERFYLEKFANTNEECFYTDKSRQVVDYLKSKGITVALATNPVFPPIATETRMGWVDLKPEDFAVVTTYDNIGYCKPNPKYYTEIAEELGVSPNECLMVGNDVSDDMSAQEAGMDVFLLTDCLINSKGADCSSFPQGSFDDLVDYVNSKI